MLKGMGVTIGLPLLEAMVPAATVWGSQANRKTRLVSVEMVHGAAGSTAFGIQKNMWAPAAVGSGFDLFPSALSPLDAYRDYLTIVSNTDVRNAEAFTAPEIGGDHFRSAAVFLTQSHPHQTQGSDLHAGISLDQIYAKKVGAETPIPSMQLCIENVDQAGRVFLRLFVRVYRLDQLGVAVGAAAHGARSACRLRPVVRRWRDARSAHGAAQTRPQHSRLGGRIGQSVEDQSRRHGSGAAQRLSRRRTRDRTPHPEGRGIQSQRRTARAARRARGCARFVYRTRQADVRSAGDCLYARISLACRRSS